MILSAAGINCGLKCVTIEFKKFNKICMYINIKYYNLM